MLSSLRPIWPLVTLFVSGALLAGAHAFERFGGFAPCPLCLEQRNWHWAVVGLSIVGLAAVGFVHAWSRWVAVALGLVLLGSAGWAGYHVAVEQGWMLAQCDARVDFDNLSITAVDGRTRVEQPKCDEVQWEMLGISMAGYNGLISLVAALASFLVAFGGRKQ